MAAAQWGGGGRAPVRQQQPPSHRGPEGKPADSSLAEVDLQVAAQHPANDDQVVKSFDGAPPVRIFAHTAGARAVIDLDLEDPGPLYPHQRRQETVQAAVDLDLFEQGGAHDLERAAGVVNRFCGQAVAHRIADFTADAF